VAVAISAPYLLFLFVNGVAGIAGTRLISFWSWPFWLLAAVGSLASYNADRTFARVATRVFGPRKRHLGHRTSGGRLSRGQMRDVFSEAMRRVRSSGARPGMMVRLPPKPSERRPDGHTHSE
jgi:hypothetical protein